MNHQQRELLTISDEETAKIKYESQFLFNMRSIQICVSSRVTALWALVKLSPP